jgi:23S rRNA A2030 N6-methylase RlmJ
MANTHYGNLADVFKQLGEVLTLLKPAEYWESHAGAASYSEIPAPPAERLHGIHFAATLASASHILAHTAYYRLLAQLAAQAPATPPATVPFIPGSMLLAYRVLSAQQRLRRLLCCDLDADALHSLQKLVGNHSVLECVQDDGITIVRGASYLLPAQWTTSTLAFLDPDEFDAPTDAGISPLDLACELANRGLPTLLWYGFADEAHRRDRHGIIQTRLEKSRLLNRHTRRFEVALAAAPPVPTQWGFGLLAFNLPTTALERVDSVLQSLATAYKSAPTPGPWTYTSATL